MGAQVVNQQGEVIGTVADSPRVSTSLANYAAAVERDIVGVKWNTKTIEKLIAYGAGIVGATNGFSQVSMPTNLRGLLVLAAGILLHGIHTSG